jgi:hypothetical protein
MICVWGDMGKSPGRVGKCISVTFKIFRCPAALNSMRFFMNGAEWVRLESREHLLFTLF